MFTLSRPLGRLPFIAGLSVVNIAIAASAALALTLLPSRGFSVAAVIIVAALEGAWLVLHARRFADAGRGPIWAIVFAVACFAVFLVGYVISASLWSVPEVQQEAFRTAGGIGYGHSPTEYIPVLVDAGRALASVFGAAGALLITGMIAVVMLLVAGISVVFSTVTLFLPRGGRRADPPLLPADAGRVLRRP